jgi:hypothetical protein
MEIPVAYCANCNLILDNYEACHECGGVPVRMIAVPEETFQEMSRNFPNPVEGSSKNGKFPDWRGVRGQLSTEELESLAHLSPDEMRQYAEETGFTYKTISNWRKYARIELGEG